MQLEQSYARAGYNKFPGTAETVDLPGMINIIVSTNPLSVLKFVPTPDGAVGSGIFTD